MDPTTAVPDANGAFTNYWPLDGADRKFGGGGWHPRPLDIDLRQNSVQ
jgi:hypothetical protein